MWIALASWGIVGCAPGVPVQFRLNLEGRDPAQVSSLAREEVSRFLEELFGTPEDPRLPEPVKLDLELLRQAAGTPQWERQQNGRPARPRGLYRRYCAICHGISGDGAGPAALVMDPYPRDFRLGIFVYTSTVPGAKPAREDLRRSIAQGLPGTAMPGFASLGPGVLDALVEYVIYLSIRGETERLLLVRVLDEDEPLPLSFPIKEQIVTEEVGWIWQQWQAPQERPDEFVVCVPPAPDFPRSEDWQAAVARGRQIYLSPRAQCVKCHGPEGAGDGEQAAELYDDWNYPKRGPTPAITAQRARLYTLPLRRLRVRNFREGIFRGGAGPEDLYLRIHIGLKGTPMGAVGATGQSPGVLSPEEIWDVVCFVREVAGLGPWTILRR